MEFNKSITAIILLIINIILVFLFIIPKYQESHDLQISFIKKQVEYDSQSSYYAKLSSTLKDIEEKGEILEKINSALPNNLSLSLVISFLQKKSKENQLVVKSITFSQPAIQASRQIGANEKTIKSVNLTVNLSGSYRGLKNLITSLDKSVRVFEVKNVSFSSPIILAGPTPPNLSGQLQPHDFKLEIETHSY